MEEGKKGSREGKRLEGERVHEKGRAEEQVSMKGKRTQEKKEKR